MNRPKRNFAPMPLAVLASDASPEEKLFMLALFHHDWDGERAWPGQPRIARIMGCSVRTVIRILKKLEDRGWITHQRRPNKTSAYEMNVPDMGFDEFNTAISGRDTKSRKCQYVIPGSAKMALPEVPVCHPRKCQDGTRIEPLNRAIETNTPPTPKGGQVDNGFADFKKAYPQIHGRTNPWGRARQWWEKHKPDLETQTAIMRGLEIEKKTESWKREGGAYVPQSITWLNQKRWTDAIEQHKPVIVRPRPIAQPKELNTPDTPLSLENVARLNALMAGRNPNHVRHDA